MVPSGLAAVFEALRFQNPRLEPLRALDDRQWRRTLALCDRAQLTLLLGEARGEALPEWVRARIAEDFRKTAERTRRIRNEFGAVVETLNRAGLDFVVLKGFAGTGEFVPDPFRRVQYDLDLYLAPGSAERACDALIGLGYEPLAAMEAFPTDHLPVLVRKTGWQWRGDFYDPDIPLSIDVHFRLWDDDTECFPAPGVEDFWARRVHKDWDGIGFGALYRCDALAYQALHLIRHLLRGSLRLAHVYELGWFLHARAGDAAFWDEWRTLHPDLLRRSQAIAFRLAGEWFQCAPSPVVLQEIERLPQPIARWFERYADSPLEARPNKHELWLHLSLLDSWTQRITVLRRRLLPWRLPAPVDSVFVPENQMTSWLRVRRRLRYLGHLVRRFAHHTRVLPSVIFHGAQWLFSNSTVGGLGRGYWHFLGASSLYNLGAFVFFVLYNLYLLDLGYQEDTLGWVTACMTAGSIVGTLPAAGLAERYGLRWLLVSCFAAMAVISACRIVVPVRPVLEASAFLAGVIFALYAVAVAPAVAQLAREEDRPRAFSLFFATGISVGIAGGVLGGRLPGLLGSKLAALLAGCGWMALASLAALRLRFSPPAPVTAKKRIYPTGTFMRRFLPVIAAWSLATGAFNPFFSAFFARRIGATVEQIGVTYSSAQLAQVAAILVAPYLLRRLGLVRGVAFTQAACGVALAGLGLLPGAAPGVVLAGAAYAAYMGFHFMGEPGLYSLLMNRVAPAEQGGASALSHMAIFLAQAVAAIAAGSAIAHVGYSGVIAAAAMLAVLSGFLLWRLLPEQPAD